MGKPFQVQNDVADALAKRKKRQAFFTPLILCEKLVEWLDAYPSMRVLEPSAGDGRIVHFLREAGVKQVDVCEIDEPSHERLREVGATIVGTDFLAYDPGPIYDRVAMNPPFAKHQATRHIEHAWTLLRPGGRLLSIVPTGFRHKVADNELVLPGCTHATYEGLGAEWFREYGTSISVGLVELEKDGPGDDQTCLGFPNHSTYNATITIESDGNLYRRYGKKIGDQHVPDLKRHLGEVGVSTYGVDWSVLITYVRESWGQP